MESRELIKVVILEDGKASTVNPLGDVNPPLDFVEYGTHNEAWREAEQQRRTLKYKIGWTDSSKNEPMFCNYYAYLSHIGGEDVFVLVKPVEESK